MHLIFEYNYRHHFDIYSMIARKEVTISLYLYYSSLKKSQTLQHKSIFNAESLPSSNESASKQSPPTSIFFCNPPAGASILYWSYPKQRARFTCHYITWQIVWIKSWISEESSKRWFTVDMLYSYWSFVSTAPGHSLFLSLYSKRGNLTVPVV